MFAYALLITLYVILVLFYVWCRPQTHIQPWPLLTIEPDTPDTVSSCSDTSECSPHHLCIRGHCVPMLLRGEECDSTTGEWTLTEWYGQTFVICTCKNPEFMTQKHFGGNCDVDIACGRHGRYNAVTKSCECDQEYIPVEKPFPTCRHMSAVERINLWPCEPNEIHQDAILHSDGFAQSYLDAHIHKKCFKRPCTFDILSGRPLKKAKYEEGLGCVCDVTRGQFGVRLDSFGDYVRGDGPNACVSIFQEEPIDPVKVTLYTYFYFFQRSPISFIQFEYVFPFLLQEPFKTLMDTDGQIQIGQSWPFDAMQQFFKSREPYTTRTRKCDIDRWLFIEKCNEWVMKDNNQMTDCQNMTAKSTAHSSWHALAYDFLYQYPACSIASDDMKSPEKYRGHVVLNPHHMTYRESPNLYRSNGLMLKFRRGKWTLDLAEEYNYSKYAKGMLEENIPDVHDEIIQSLYDGTFSNVRLDKFRNRKAR
ncbi:uncharacterized protein CDAR_109141 [Caerostris darwini]|uniref:Uncharacterized protein n=1 Tax=Caerostris darwini TaxID=1538125 RepID=A0AAV4PVH3_9ARAC|nr:uncharacterized protein CDAR_109141 [Caerostris darwini]